MANQGYIRLVAPGSKTPWQANFSPVAGATPAKNVTNDLGLFASVKDAEVVIEAKVGKKLTWTLQKTADQVPLYIGTS